MLICIAEAGARPAELVLKNSDWPASRARRQTGAPELPKAARCQAGYGYF